MLLWALVVLRCGSTYTFAMLQHVLLERLDRLNERDLRTVVWAYAKSDAVCGTLFKGLADWIVRKQLLDSYHPRTLTVLAHGYVQRQIKHTELLRGVASAATPKLSDFAPADLGNLLWSMAASSTHDVLLLRASE